MNTDYITGLLGTGEFIMESNRILHSSEKRYAFITTDISNFKYLNTFYGMEEGNQLILEMAKFFYIDNPNCVTACRTGCDQIRGLFSIGDKSTQEEQDYIIKMNSDFEAIVAKKYPKVFLHMYTGVYFIEDNSEDVNVAIDKAHLAKKTVKGNFNNKCQVYSDELFSAQIENMEMVKTFEKACDDNRILVYLQPKYSSSTNTMIGAEALVRLQGEDGSIIPPGKFIPNIERNGMIYKLDGIMLENVFKIQQNLMKANKALVPISVNISRMGFSNPDFVKHVIELQQQYQVPSNMIELEITESTLIEAMDTVEAAITQLRENGFRISVDDFGSGYSSLNQIASIPADVIKLDGIFARKGIKTIKGRKVVKAIIEMLISIDYEVICEGVETSEECNIINFYGCDNIQGYYFSKPKPWQEVFNIN